MTGSYTRALGQVIVQDLPRFTGVFLITAAAFLFSYLFAIKAHREAKYPKEHFIEMLQSKYVGCRQFTGITCGDYWRWKTTYYVKSIT